MKSFFANRVLLKAILTAFALAAAVTLPPALTARAAPPSSPATDELMRSAAEPLAAEVASVTSEAAKKKFTWPATSAWKVMTPCPIARFESYGFSYGGNLYVMGGWADSTFHSTRRVDVYNPVSNKWKRLKDMQAPETHAGVAVDEGKGVVYFVAGHRGTYPSTPTKDVWKYTIATDSWTKLHAELPYLMGANNAAVVGNELHSFGGNYSDRVTNTFDHFALDLDKVDKGFRRVKSFPAARDHLSHVVIDDKIFALGGEFGHDKKHLQQSFLHVYDPAANAWTRLANVPISKSHAESSTFLLSGRIISAGGQSTPQSPTSGVYAYDPSNNTWTTLARLPASRQGTVVQKVGDYFVLTCGGIQTFQPQSTTWVAKAG